MKTLNEKQIEKAFEKWNKEYIENPEKFRTEWIKGEELSIAQRQTKTLFKYVKNN